MVFSSRLLLRRSCLRGVTVLSLRLSACMSPSWHHCYISTSASLCLQRFLAWFNVTFLLRRLYLSGVPPKHENEYNICLVFSRNKLGGVSLSIAEKAFSCCLFRLTPFVNKSPWQLILLHRFFLFSLLTFCFFAVLKSDSSFKTFSMNRNATKNFETDETKWETRAVNSLFGLLFPFFSHVCFGVSFTTPVACNVLNKRLRKCHWN